MDAIPRSSTRPMTKQGYIELTLAELKEFRDEADMAGNEKLFQHYCRKIDELENEESNE